MEDERRQLRGIAVAGGVAAAGVVGLLVWSGGSAPDVGAGDAPSAPSPETDVADTAAPPPPPPDAPPSTAAPEVTEAAVGALVGRLPDPPNVTPIGDLDAPGRPAWLLFDQPLETVRNDYAGALMTAGLSAAPGPVPPGAPPASAVLVVTDPGTDAQVLVMFEQLGPDVDVTVQDVPADYDASAPAGTLPPPSPEVAAIALLAALPTPTSALVLDDGGDMRRFEVRGVPYHDVAWEYLAQLQEAGYSVAETDRGEGLLTIAVTDLDGGAVTVDLLDRTTATEIVAFT